MGKASLWSVPVDHFCTLYDNRTGRCDWRGITAQVFLPLIGGAVTWMLGAKITDVSGAVSGISIVAGLLFTMAVFLFQLRITLDNDKRLGDDDFALVDECMANTLWAILWGVMLAVYLIVCDAGKWICNDSHRPLPARDRHVPQAAPPGVRAHRNEVPMRRMPQRRYADHCC